MSESDLAELEKRIGAAMARIGRAVEGIAGADGVPRGEFEAAVAEADSARGRQVAAEKRAAAAEAEVTRLKEALETETTANAQLRERNATLKGAKETAQARIEELSAALNKLQEARDADRTELDELIAALDPLVREQPHA